MVAANVLGFNQAWQTQANTRINAAAAVPSAVSSAVSGRSALTMADKIELMGVPQTQSSVEEESAADEIQLRLQRMTELAELSASDEIEDADRAGLQEETEALKSDIDRIALFSAGPEAADAAEPSAQAEGVGGVSAVSNEKSHAQADGDPVLASWSGTLDPGEIEAGDTITVNNIEFEFVKDPGADGIHKINIFEDDNTTKESAEVIAERFVKAVTSSTVKEEFKENWKIRESDLPKDENDEFGVSCEWSKGEAAEGTEATWTLKFQQKGSEFQDGNGFVVKTGSTSKLAEPDNDTTYGVHWIVLSDIKKSQAGNNYTLQVGDASITVKVQDIPAERTLVWDDKNGEMRSGTLYVQSTVQFGTKTEPGSLAYGLKQVLTAKGYSGYDVLVSEYGTSNSLFDISISAIIDSDPDKLSELNIYKGNSKLPDTPGTDAKENKAYLEFKVDLDKLSEGDRFNFRGMEFVFGTEEKEPEDNFVYIKIDDPSEENYRKMAEAFRDEFNSRFAVKAPSKNEEFVPSTGYISSGATNTGKAQPWYENLEKLLAAGVFEMRCFVKGNTAFFSIYAKTEEVLNENGEIELSGEGEGWKTAESSGEVPEEGETPAEPERSGGEPAAMSSEALGISSVNVATRSGAAQAASTLSAAGDKLSAAKAEAVESTEASGKLRNGDEAAQAVEDVKGQLEEDSAEGLKAQSGKLEAGAARKLTQE